MKKKVVIIFACFIVALTITGCDSFKETNKQKVIKKEISEAQSESFDINKDQPFFSSNDIRKTEKGYYLMRDDLLYFIDEESMKGIVVCSSPKCEHNSEKCSGYFGRYGENGEKGYWPGMLVSKEKIYIVGYELADNCNNSLFSINHDASNREKIGKLYSTEESEFTFDYTIHNGSMYRVEYDDSSAYLIKLNPKDLKKETIFDMKGKYGVDIESVMGYGDYIYFNVDYFEDKEMKNAKSVIYRYNTKINTTEVFIEDLINNGFKLINENEILYMDLDYNLKIRNIETEKERIIRKTTGVFGNFSFDGNYVFFYGVAQEESEENGYVFVYDLGGKLINKISLHGGECLFGDSKYLFCRDQFDKDGNWDESALL